MFAGGERDVWELPLSFETMQAAFNKGYIDIPFITRDEILDKNGRDGLSKALAMLQLTWFIIQIAARIHQGLAVTELELTTAALASLNIAMYISWWSKPTDIQCPTVITTKGLQIQDRRWMHSVSLPSSPPADQGKSTGSYISSSSPDRAQLTDQTRTSSPLSDEKESDADVVKTHYLINQVVEKERVNLVTHYWNEFTKALRESLMAIVTAPAKLVNGLIGLASELGAQISGIWGSSTRQNSTSDQKSTSNDPPSNVSSSPDANTPPSFSNKAQRTVSLIWKTITHLFLALLYYPILAILGKERNGNPPITPEQVKDMSTVKLMVNMDALRFVMDMIFFCEHVAGAPFLCLSAFSGAIFGMIHCLAWNFEFPSHIEQILWRTSASVIAGLCTCVTTGALAYIIKQARTKATSSPGQGDTSTPAAHHASKEGKHGIMKLLQSVYDFLNITEIVCTMFAICFVLTRLSLISLSIIGLRALPASAFDTVQWSGFIPHI